MAGKNYLEKVKDVNDLIAQFMDRLHEQGAKYSNITDVLSPIRVLIDAIETTELAHTNTQTYLGFSAAVENAKEVMNEYFGRNERSDLSEEEQQIYDTMLEVRKTLDGDVVNSIKRSSELHSEFIRDYATGKSESKITKYRDFILGNITKKPNVDECLSMSVYNKDMEKTMSQLTWILFQKGKAGILDAVHDDENQSIYEKTFRRLMEEVTEAPSDIQAKFISEYLYYAEAAKDLALFKYNSLRQTYPQDPDHPDYKDLLALKYSDEYLFADATREVNTLINMTNAAGEQFVFSTFRKEDAITYGQMFGENLPDHKKAEDRIVKENRDTTVIGDLIGGDMYKAMNKLPGFARKISSHDIVYYEDSLAQSGYLHVKEFEDVIDIYTKIRNDKSLDSEHFNIVRDKLRTFINMNQNYYKSPAYINAYNEALYEAEKYVKNHSGIKFTSAGRRRVEDSNIIAEKLRAYKKQINSLYFDPKTAKQFVNSSKDVGEITKECVKEAFRVKMDKSDFVQMMKTVSSAAEPYDVPEEYSIQDFEERGRRKQLSEKAKETYYSAKYDTQLKYQLIDLCEKYKSEEESLTLVKENPGLAQILLKSGNDIETRCQNLDVLNSMLYSQGEEENAQRTIAELLKEKYEELSDYDYDELLAMNEEQLAEHYEEIEQQLHWTAICRETMDRLTKTNPFVSEELADQYNALADKYAKVYAYFTAKMEIMQDPNYADVKTDSFEAMRPYDFEKKISHVDGADKGTQRFAKQLKKLNTVVFDAFGDQMVEADPENMQEQLAEKVRIRLSVIKNNDRLNPAQKSLETDIIGTEYELCLMEDAMHKASEKDALLIKSAMENNLAKYLAQITIKAKAEKENVSSETLKRMTSKNAIAAAQNSMQKSGFAARIMNRMIDDGESFANTNADKMMKKLVSVQKTSNFANQNSLAEKKGMEIDAIKLK